MGGSALPAFDSCIDLSTILPLVEKVPDLQGLLEKGMVLAARLLQLIEVVWKPLGLRVARRGQSSAHIPFEILHNWE
jgi:hypothetical protein